MILPLLFLLHHLFRISLSHSSPFPAESFPSSFSQQRDPSSLVCVSHAEASPSSFCSTSVYPTSSAATSIALASEPGLPSNTIEAAPANIYNSTSSGGGSSNRAAVAAAATAAAARSPARSTNMTATTSAAASSGSSNNNGAGSSGPKTNNSLRIISVVPGETEREELRDRLEQSLGYSTCRVPRVLTVAQRRRAGMVKQWSMDETKSWFYARSSSLDRQAGAAAGVPGSTPGDSSAENVSSNLISHQQHHNPQHQQPQQPHISTPSGLTPPRMSAERRRKFFQRKNTSSAPASSTESVDLSRCGSQDSNSSQTSTVSRALEEVLRTTTLMGSKWGAGGGSGDLLVLGAGVSEQDQLDKMRQEVERKERTKKFKRLMTLPLEEEQEPQQPNFMLSSEHIVSDGTGRNFAISVCIDSNNDSYS